MCAVSVYISLSSLALSLSLSVTLVHHLCVSHMHTHHVRLSYCDLLCTVLLFDTDNGSVIKPLCVRLSNVLIPQMMERHQAIKLWVTVFFRSLLCQCYCTYTHTTIVSKDTVTAKVIVPIHTSDLPHTLIFFTTCISTLCKSVRGSHYVCMCEWWV